LKYVDAFRDGRLARAVRAEIEEAVDPARRYRLMEFCGGHTHAIFRYGVPELLPANVALVHGPGCPVCVLPMGRLDMAIDLALCPGVTLCTYGDMLRVPGSRRRSLLEAKAEGADVRMVYSAADAVAIARAEPTREVVFFAIGFETTTPPTAVALKQAIDERLANFSVFCNHVLTPSAIRAILDAPADEVGIDGFLGPAHVSVVIGTEPYDVFAHDYGKPVVVAGFEPLDVLQSILMLIRQLNDGRAEVENQYTRAVTRRGNPKAQALMDALFERRDAFEWRGLGTIPLSALRLRPAYAAFDAEMRFDLAATRPRENRACRCPEILRGAAEPDDCALFATVCAPETPIGACMVSAEGACAAHYAYRRRAPARPAP
jgi:hydrogenase expression/formation protein HypD